MTEKSDIPKSTKVVKLSVIKTNAERRKRKTIAKEIASLEGAVNEYDVIGYAVVLWTRDGQEVCYWDTGALGVQGPIRGELAKRALERVSNKRDMDQMLYGEDEG